ncbi:MAG: PD-(D/E)XK nuclease family protein [Desulfamplus sp.]|nr:PD-(D/E)XK nuclease family protein [Desulfamplus sp.]
MDIDSSILEMRKQPHLSASSIKAYLDCGLYYKFSRIDKLARTHTSDNLIFGSTIHKVLADYNQEKLIGNHMGLDDLYELFKKYWTEAVKSTDNIKYSKGKTFESLLKQGKELLRTYMSQAPRDQYEIMAVEEPFEFKIDGVDLPVIGVMDIVERDENDTVIISDYKTVGTSTTINEVDNNFQLTVYYMAAKLNGYVDREIVLKLDCLVKTKTPRFEQVYTSRNSDDEQRAVKKIKEVCNGIQKEVFIPNADGSWKCGGCEYKVYCDDWFEN